jgi:ATP-dependent helicase/nuclease subunit B
MMTKQTQSSALPEQVSLHVGDEMDLLDRACHSPQPTEIILAPVELHRRNIQRRLREDSLPKESFTFEDAISVSQACLKEGDGSARAIDRIDRLSLVNQLCDESVVERSTIDFPPSIQSRDPQYIEQIRTEVEALSNFHPERISAWEKTVDDLPTPIDADTVELLEVALNVEEELRAETDKAISDGELIRRAIRQLTATSGETWTTAFDNIDRLSMVGLSSISAPYADLIHAVAMTTPVDIHIHFRPATGDYLTERVPPLFDISSLGEVVFE